MTPERIAKAVGKILAEHALIDGVEWCVYEPEGDDAYIDITICEGMEEQEMRIRIE